MGIRQSQVKKINNALGEHDKAARRGASDKELRRLAAVIEATQRSASREEIAEAARRDGFR